MDLAILPLSSLHMYDIVNNVLHTTRQAMHIVYITFAKHVYCLHYVF